MLERDFIDVGSALRYAFDRHGLQRAKLCDYRFQLRQLPAREAGELCAHQIVPRLSEVQFLNRTANRGFGSVCSRNRLATSA